MCKVFKKFHCHNIEKKEITIDFNGPGDQLSSFNYSKTEQWIFFKLHQVILLIIVDNLRLYHLVMWIQQP